jgi:predicted GNAT family N-acyltransferase
MTNDRADVTAFNVRVMAKVREAFPDVRLWLSTYGVDRVSYLDQVVVPKDARKQGVGTKVMELIVAEADRDDVTIVLTPSIDLGATSTSRLARFYRRFGFERNRGRHYDARVSSAMIRRPRPSAAKALDESFVPSRTWYHGTGPEAAKKINASGRLEHGFEKNDYPDVQGLDGRLYLTNRPSVAELYAKRRSKGKKGKGVVFEVDAGDIPWDKAQPDEEFLVWAYQNWDAVKGPGDEEVLTPEDLMINFGPDEMYTINRRSDLWHRIHEWVLKNGPEELKRRCAESISGWDDDLPQDVLDVLPRRGDLWDDLMEATWSISVPGPIKVKVKQPAVNEAARPIPHAADSIDDLRQHLKSKDVDLRFWEWLVPEWADEVELPGHERDDESDELAVTLSDLGPSQRAAFEKYVERQVASGAVEDIDLQPNQVMRYVRDVRPDERLVHLTSKMNARGLVRRGRFGRGAGLYNLTCTKHKCDPDEGEGPYAFAFLEEDVTEEAREAFGRHAVSFTADAAILVEHTLDRGFERQVIFDRRRVRDLRSEDVVAESAASRKALADLDPTMLDAGEGGERPSPEQVTSAVLKLVAEMGEDPIIINSGDCDTFAERLVGVLGYGVAEEIMDDDDDGRIPNHAWVDIDGRYYDAEVPSGVDDWRDLPVFTRWFARRNRRVVTETKTQDDLVKYLEDGDIDALGALADLDGDGRFDAPPEKRVATEQDMDLAIYDWLHSDEFDLGYLGGADPEYDKLNAAHRESLRVHTQKMLDVEYDRELAEWEEEHGEVQDVTKAYAGPVERVDEATWLVHFSDRAEDIADHGFKFGASAEFLALTERQGEKAARGMFAFAFEAESIDALEHWQSGRTYGDAMVFFRAEDAVSAHHLGDREQQVVFNRHTARDRVFCEFDRDDKKRGATCSVVDRHGKVAFSSDYEQVVDWIKVNYASARRDGVVAEAANDPTGPLTVYHGTSAAQVSSIQERGLIPGASRGMGDDSGKNPFVYVARTKKTASWFARNNTRRDDPAVVTAELRGKIYETEARGDMGAFGKVCDDLGVPFAKEGTRIMDLAAVASALRKAGYAGVSFRDGSANGGAAIAALPEALTVVGSKPVTEADLGVETSLAPGAGRETISLLPVEGSAEVKAVYLTDDVSMARAYANGRKKDAHVGASKVEDGVIFVVDRGTGFREVGGDVWQTWADDAVAEAREWLEDTDEEPGDGLAMLLEACDLTLDEETARRVLEDPSFLLDHLDEERWMSIQNDWHGYAELAVAKVDWEDVVAILEYDEDGKLVRTTKGGSRKRWRGKFEPEDFYYHGSPREIWKDKLDSLNDVGGGDSKQVAESASSVRFADLPDDMQVLIMQFVEDFGDESESEVDFDELTLPVAEVHVGLFPSVEMETDYRTVGHALEMDLDATPPILIAHGEWLDGRHRVYKAIYDGRRTVRAIDLTHLLPNFKPGSGDSLGTLRDNPISDRYLDAAREYMRSRSAH